MKKIWLLSFPLCLLSCLNANDFYVKVGAATIPTEDWVAPSVGLGTRWQQGHHGYDLSANVTSILISNYASVKGMYLFYPSPGKHQFYMAIGPGIGYIASTTFGWGDRECGLLLGEGLLGYEWKHSKNLKTFVQLELSQPVYKFHTMNASNNYRPGVGLSFGIGF